MKILAIDTATEACSVALSLGDQPRTLFELCPQQHAQRILPMVDQLLSEAGISLQQLDGLAFGQGPGSFTGVRIATSIVQGFALATSLPVVGISTLASMAQACIMQRTVDRVAVAIDARMNEVYFACYENVQGFVQLVGQEEVLLPELVQQRLGNSVPTFAGTGWQAYPLLNTLLVDNMPTVLYPSAEAMLPLAEQQLIMGTGKRASQIEPSYVRNTVTWKKLPGR